MARGGSLKPRAARDFFIIEDEPTAEEDDACAVDFGLCTFCGVLPITQPERSADESLDRAVMVVALPQSPEDPALDAYASDASAVVRRDSGPRIVRRLSSRPLLWQKAEAQEASEIGAEVAPQLSVVEQYLAWEGGRLAPERVAELRALLGVHGALLSLEFQQVPERRWLVRYASHEEACAAVASVPAQLTGVECCLAYNDRAYDDRGWCARAPHDLRLLIASPAHESVRTRRDKSEGAAASGRAGAAPRTSSARRSPLASRWSQQ